MKRLFILLAALFAAPLVPQAPADVVGTPTKHCTKIPDDKGRAGMAASIISKPNGIVMLGGANFPNAIEGAKTPEERGAKVYYDDIYFWKDGKKWLVGKMPYPVGYAAFGTADGSKILVDGKKTADFVIVAGGENADGCLTKVTRIDIKDRDKEEIKAEREALIAEKTKAGEEVDEDAIEINKYTSVITALPDLPIAVSTPAFVVMDNVLYVMGGVQSGASTECSAACYKLNLQDTSKGWEEIAPMPAPRQLAAAAAVNDKIYVVGGCSLAPNEAGAPVRTYLNDVWVYSPQDNAWAKVDTAAPEAIVGAANPMPVKIDKENGSRIYLICGDPGNYYRASLEGNAPAVHPGQNTAIYSYNVTTREWVREGDNVIGIATAPAVQRGETIYVISGETHPGVRTPVISTLEIMDSGFYKNFIKPIVDDVRSFCESSSPYTVWGAAVIFVLAILLGVKKGFKNKPIPLNAAVAKPGKWAWAAVAVLWVVVMLNYFDRQLLAVLNTSITEGEGCINMTQAQFGMVTSAFLIVYAILSPVGGFLADRFSRKFIILVSLVVWSVVTWFTGDAKSYGELLFYRAAMGISEAFYIPAALALITDYHRGKTRSLATGLHMSGIYAGQMLAGCGAMMSGAPFNLGWRLTFEAFGFIGVAYALIVILFLHDPEAPAEAAPAADAAATEEKKEEEAAAAAPAEEAKFGIMEVLKNLFSTRAMAMLLLLISFAGAANWFLMGWYPRLLQDMSNLSEADAGPTATLWINIAKYVAVLGGAFVADMWYTRNKNARAYVPGICFLIAGPCVMIAMLPAIGIPFALGLGVTVGLVSMQGVAQGSLDATLMPVLRSHIDERFSATGYGLLNLTSVGAGALVSWLGGYLKDANVGLGVPLCVAGALMMVCGALLFLLPKHK